MSLSQSKATDARVWYAGGGVLKRRHESSRQVVSHLQQLAFVPGGDDVAKRLQWVRYDEVSRQKRPEDPVRDAARRVIIMAAYPTSSVSGK